MPGLGSLMIAAVRTKDTPIVMAAVITIAVIAGFINLFVDILYTFIDPRLKSDLVKN